MATDACCSGPCSKGYDARKEHETAVAAGVAGASCYDYVRDSVQTFKLEVKEKQVTEYLESIVQCGKVQKFGCFLVVHPDTRCVLACSGNTDAFLGRPWTEVMGSTIDSLFVESQKVLQVLELGDLSSANPVLLTPASGTKVYNAIVSLAAMQLQDPGTGQAKDGAGIIFEIEETGFVDGESAPEGMWHAHQLMREAVLKVGRCDSLEKTLAIAVEEIHKLTGLDRVMVYKFHPDMHGEVVEEYKSEHVDESLLGLHYPATDIPQINRELFKLNRVRLVHDVKFGGDPIMCDARRVVDTKEISLLRAVLRQPHGCHLEYLENMGVTSTLTLAIVVEDELWGLFACHHYGGGKGQPRFVPFQHRAACDFLAQSVSARVKAMQQLERSKEGEKTNHLHIALCEKMKRHPHAERICALVGAPPNLLNCVPHAEGAAVVLNSVIYTQGAVPSDEMIRRILSVVLPRHHKKAAPSTAHVHASQVVGVDCLSDLLPNSQMLAHMAAGMLSVALKDEKGFLVCVCVCVCVCVYARPPARTHARTHARTRAHTHTHTNTHKHARTHARARTHTGVVPPRVSQHGDIRRQAPRRERDCGNGTNSEQSMYSALIG